MSIVTKLSVYNFRSHDTITVDLSPNITVVTGKNGAGKTSLIEAIYMAFQGTSFKGNDMDIIKKGCSWWRVELSTNNLTRIVRYDSKKDTKKKQFTINNKISYRLLPADKHPVVLFESDDLRLLHGSPVRRRYFINNFISQLDLQYSKALHKYERALKQRNTLIKNRTSQESLFAWNISLSRYGAYIIEKRLEYLNLIQDNLQKEYRNIAHVSDILNVNYSSQYNGNISQQLLDNLNKNYKRDLELGYTTVGPHRHDILFLFNNTPAEIIASRGETRSLILALKFIETNIIHKKTQKSPIILFDDVFSELDENRQIRLISNDYQSVFTATRVPLEAAQFARVDLS